MANADAMIEKLESQLDDLKTRISKIKSYREENAPEKLRKEIEEYKEKIKEQEKEIKEIKEIEKTRRFKDEPIVADAVFTFPPNTKVVLGVQ